MRSREVIRFNVKVKVIYLKVSELQLGRQSSHAPVQVWNFSLMGRYIAAQEREILSYFATEAWNYV